jgi:pimeloyl-ACP methyl ester carboxylesterase
VLVRAFTRYRDTTRFSTSARRGAGGCLHRLRARPPWPWPKRPYREASSLQHEVQDLDAVLTKTGAYYVFGVSSGGILCLQAALTRPAIDKAAIFEPPLSLTRSAATAVLTRFDQELAQGRVAAALITGMKGAQMGPPLFNVLPRWLVELLVNVAMKSEEQKGAGGYVPMRVLAPTLHYDFQLVVEMSGKLESFKAIRAEVLLLGGRKRPAYLKAALDALEEVLPQARRVEFPGLDHAATWNTDRGGQPEPVPKTFGDFLPKMLLPISQAHTMRK